MFDDHTAWFSSSVENDVIDQWEQNKGSIADIDEAQFIFSKDSEISDTKRLYKSEAYLNEHLAIFHAQYIEDCVKRGNTRDIVLGKYFLPPLPVQTFMKKQISFVWEKNKNSSTTNTNSTRTQKNTTTSASTSVQKSTTQRTITTRNSNTTPEKSNTTQKTTTTSTQRRDTTNEINDINEQTMARKKKVKSKSSNLSPSKDLTNKQSSLTVVLDTNEDHVVVNEDDIVYIGDLPQVRGKVEDFIPGENGCEVFMKT